MLPDHRGAPSGRPGAIPPGTRLDRYRVLGELGRGGMGVVLKAQEDGLDRIVAIKILPRDVAADARTLERFRREAKGAAAVTHPNITTLYAFGDANGWPYMVFEFLAGGSLQDRVKKEGPLPWREVAKVGAEVAHALGAIHAAGLVHRDLKPANILLDASGRAKLGDFGLVRREASGNSLTGAGELLGTAAYLSPEQAGDAKVDSRADLYSFGATLYALLTGRPPFEGEGFQVITKHLTARPEPPSKLVPDIPKPLEKIVLRLLEKKPDARGPGAEELALELEALLASDDAPARKASGRRAPSTRVDATSGRSGRYDVKPASSKTPLIVGVIAGVALLGVGAVAMRPAAPPPAVQPPPPPPPPPTLPALPLELVVDEPRDDDRAIEGERVRVSGTVKADGAEVRVAANGTSLPVIDGRFKGVVRLAPSAKSLAVVATRGATERRVERRLRVERAPDWYAAIPLYDRPKWPLPRGVEWSTSARCFVKRLPGSEAIDLPLVYVPGGTFIMGANGLHSLDREEEPEHPHEVAGFFIGRYEVTNKQFFAFCGATDHRKPNLPDFHGFVPNEDNPIVHMTWLEAKEFCAWAGVRLPFEAEWEKAARGGGDDRRIYPWGGEVSREEVQGIASWNPNVNAWANFAGKESLTLEQKGYRDKGWGVPRSADKHPWTAPVGSYEHDVSPFGCFDMAGNVSEMCEDFHESHVYARYATGDFKPPSSGRTHVVRGGSFATPWWNCRVTCRSSGGSVLEGTDSAAIGFRVALSEED